jgi:hypothetical protein
VMNRRRRLRGERKRSWKRFGWGDTGGWTDGCAGESVQRGRRIRRFLARLDWGSRRDGVLVFILQTFLQTVDAFEQGFEDVCFGAAFFGDGI